MADITGAPVFQDHVRQLETTDPTHPSTWNPNYQTIINNDAFLKGRSDISGLLGSGFLPAAGSETVSYDEKNRVSTITYSGEAVGVATCVYDDANGGRVDYVELVLTAPEAITIRHTYSYDDDNNITGRTRTVS